MKNKKIIAVLICLIFIMITAEASTSRYIFTDKKEQTDTITLYRHGLYGEIKPVNVEILLKDGMDISELITEKCKELFDNDIEFQSYLKAIASDENNSEDDFINNTNMSMGLGLFFVYSRGKGLFLQTKMFGKILLKFLFKKIDLPSFLIRPKKQILICGLTNNRSVSIIKPIFDLWGNNNTLIFKGQHAVAYYGFRGYTSWHKRIKYSPVFPKSLVGFCRQYDLFYNTNYTNRIIK